MTVQRTHVRQYDECSVHYRRLFLLSLFSCSEYIRYLHSILISYWRAARTETTTTASLLFRARSRRYWEATIPYVCSVHVWTSGLWAQWRKMSSEPSMINDFCCQLPVFDGFFLRLHFVFAVLVIRFLCYSTRPSSSSTCCCCRQCCRHRRPAYTGSMTFYERVEFGILFRRNIFNHSLHITDYTSLIRFRFFLYFNLHQWNPVPGNQFVHRLFLSIYFSSFGSICEPIIRELTASCWTTTFNWPNCWLLLPGRCVMSYAN